MMSSWAKNFTNLGRDGYNLARVFVQHRGSNVKPLLLEHARQSNTVATGILKAEKEIRLVKYHGLSGYMKQRLQSTSALATSSNSESETASPFGRSPSGSTAKIAFMVTASMKQELSENLGYNTDQIKTMTPLQASLILNDGITPDEMESKLPLAEEAHEIQRQKEEEEARLFAEQQQVKATTGADIQDISGGGVMAHHTEHFGSGGGFMSRNELDAARKSSIGEFFSTSEWFEVTEIKADGSSNRVGLYTNEEEAKLGLETRQEIADAKNTRLKFDMHRISASELEA